MDYQGVYNTTSFQGECTVSVEKRKYVDSNKFEMNLHQGVYTIGPVKMKCMIKEDSQLEPVTFSSYCILKKFRHMNAVSVENFYLGEHGEGRMVLSWVDETLKGWLLESSAKRHKFKSFESTHMHSKPSPIFRKMIIDLCSAVETMFRNGVYPKSVSLDDIYLVNSKKNLTLKILVSEVVDLSREDDNTKSLHKEWIWKKLRAVVKDCCRIAATRSVYPDSLRFCSYVGVGTWKLLETYPDIWTDEEKICYLFFIMSGKKSIVQNIVNGIKGFKWPEDDSGKVRFLIRELTAHQERKCKKRYNQKDPYDYLWLCRNVIKHWASLPKYLKVDCKDVPAFLRKMEMWSPRVWCILYEAFET